MVRGATGLTTGETTEIVEGLGGGEQLIVKGQSYLSEGADVRVVVRDGEEVPKAEAPKADAAAAPDAEAAGTEG